MWTFDPKAYEDGQPPNGTGFVHRGVAAWRDGTALRIFMNSRAKLFCLDAKTGEPVNGVRRARRRRSDARACAGRSIPKRYTNTSPPVVYKDLVILGNGVGDRLTYRQDPPGDVRAFDAQTGKQVWSFHTVPDQGEPGVDTWGDESWKFTGHTNVWAPMSLDDRRAAWCTCRSARRATTSTARGGPGRICSAIRSCVSTRRRASASGTSRSSHHGLWDYDPASAPSLVTIKVDGRAIDAVVQLTKQGFVFVFDRVTGKPVWPIEERPVPASDVDGRAGVADAAVPDAARADLAAGHDARRSVRSDAGARRRRRRRS